jgi:hypothetical protein
MRLRTVKSQQHRKEKSLSKKPVSDLFPEEVEEP